MLVSLRWLKDYVDVELGPGELAERLTMVGLEVDSVTEVGPEFTNVVVAKILSIKPHPGADKLSLCEVATGDKTYSVVCGAKNINIGDIVPLALVGATIPGGYTIKSSKIRGEKSYGMLCSEDELGLGEDASGIMILPKGLSPGENLTVALDLKDTVFDIGITPNRSDCLSIIGIAREVAVITGKKLRYPEIAISESEDDIADITSVEILNPDLCPRYTARLIKNVNVVPSPRWMRLRLEAVGLRAINNIVDITNFVMMEFGQPLHAFDFRFLEEERIIVRGAQEGEKFVSLDGKERILRADTLMICDGVKPVAVAGIMGGLNSEVIDDTETVLLESAYFDPTSIRKTSKWLGMSTDASFRFERGVDPEGVLRASARAAQLIAVLSGGKICRDYIDRYPRRIKSVKNIPLRVKKVNETLGIKIKAGEIKKILKNLEMTVNKAEDVNYHVTPPTFRVDISREIDIIEEIVRIFGYDSIPTSLPSVSIRPDIRNKEKTLEDNIRNILNGQGYSEVINYSFITPQSANILGLEKNDERRKFVIIKNPLTEDQSVMRTGLVYGLLDTMRKNTNVGCFDLKIFEKGKAYILRGKGKLPLENERIGGLITGSRYHNLWYFKGLLSDFYDLKGCVENLFNGLMIQNVKFKTDANLPFLHPGKSCGVFVDNEEIGFVGEVHPEVLEKMDLKRSAVVFELDFDFLERLYNNTESTVYKEIPKFPSITRDVAFLVGRDVESGRLHDLVFEENEDLLEKVVVFDVYHGKNIPDGMKSLALRFTYRSPDKTLTDDEVDKVHNRIAERIVNLTKAKIRGKED